MRSNESDDTAERILAATRRALVERGYGEFSMSAVAAEFDGSQSLIHYHFDSREGLLAALLERERERYVEYFETYPDDPEARLERLLDEFVREFDEWAEESEMAPRYVELFAAATDSERVREALRDLHALFREEIERAVVDGVEAGVFEPVDPAEIASLVKAGNASVTNRWVLDEPDESAATAAAVESVVNERVYGGEGPDRTPDGGEL